MKDERVYGRLGVCERVRFTVIKEIVQKPLLHPVLWIHQAELVFL